MLADGSGVDGGKEEVKEGKEEWGRETERTEKKTLKEGRKVVVEDDRNPTPVGGMCT